MARMSQNGNENGNGNEREQGRLFRGISTLYTLEGAAQKQGRWIVGEDLSPIPNAAVVERNGRIEWVGPASQVPAAFAKERFEEIDLDGRVVIPALVESHTHLVHAGNRAAEFEQRNQGIDYREIAASGGGILSTVRSTRQATFESLHASAQERADRFVSQGVTTIEVKSGYGLTVEDELKMLRAAGRIERARIVRTFLGAHAVPPEFPSARAYLDRLVTEAFPRLEAEGLACRVDIFVENGYFQVDQAREYLRKAKQNKFDVVVHADQLTRCGGSGLAVELGARSAEHLVCVNHGDIECLAKSEVTCVLLPSADLYMKCAYPPARTLIDSGARLALATDFNPGTSPSMDVALVGVLARIEMKMSLAEVLGAYTVGGAHALGLQSDLGSISVGKYCDFSVLTGPLEELFLSVGQMPIVQSVREGHQIWPYGLIRP